MAFSESRGKEYRGRHPTRLLSILIQPNKRTGEDEVTSNCFCAGAFSRAQGDFSCLSLGSHGSPTSLMGSGTGLSESMPMQATSAQNTRPTAPLPSFGFTTERNWSWLCPNSDFVCTAIFMTAKNWTNLIITVDSFHQTNVRSM
jgi:hypothetical protein